MTKEEEAARKAVQRELQNVFAKNGLQAGEVRALASEVLWPRVRDVLQTEKYNKHIGKTPARLRGVKSWKHDLRDHLRDVWGTEESAGLFSLYGTDQYGLPYSRRWRSPKYLPKTKPGRDPVRGHYAFPFMERLITQYPHVSRMDAAKICLALVWVVPSLRVNRPPRFKYDADNLRKDFSERPR